MKTLHQITSNLVVKQQGEQRPPAMQASSVNAGPAAAGGGPAPSRAVPAAESAPHKNTLSAATIVGDFGHAGRREAALGTARARLETGGEDFWSELFLAMQTMLFNPDPASRPASSEPYVQAMLGLPETYVELLRKRLTPVLVIDLWSTSELLLSLWLAVPPYTACP